MSICGCHINKAPAFSFYAIVTLVLLLDKSKVINWEDEWVDHLELMFKLFAL